MKPPSMKPLIFLQVVLAVSGMLAFTGGASAQRPSPADSMSVPKAVATVPMGPKEFAEKKKNLLKIKQVDKWAPKGTIKGQTGQFVVELTPQECTFLGGTVVYWPHCADTYMKCVASNGREMCVDELIAR